MVEYNLFDGLKEIMFGVTTGIMGYMAYWRPSANALSLDFNEDFLLDETQKARVHYKDATMAFELTGQSTKFDQPRFMMEYFTNDFKLLKAAVDDSGQSEKVSIILGGELKEFDVVSVDTKYDGGTSVAFLNPVGD